MAYKGTRLKFFLLLAVFLAGISYPVPSPAQQGSAPVIIRDTEIEETFRDWMTPLLQAAGIDKDGVHLVLVQSPQINAFVAGGANIFVYTGLLEKTDNPGEVIGVLAHELGHIAGGHLIAQRSAMERASYESILGMVLGVGAAIVTGDGGAASAVIAGSTGMAQRRYLAHSRVQESSADQAGLRFLESAAINPEGFESFLLKLESEELLPTEQQSEYMRTHPLTRDRIDAVHERAGQSPSLGKGFPQEWTEQHKRMKAKLVGFTSPGQVPWVYDDRDSSVAARYARAIAAYRDKNVDKALGQVDGLLLQEPENPYFQELKGQMLMEFGRVDESIPWYKKAVEKLPRAGLIRTALGHALLESKGGDAALQEAVDQLERARRDEPRSSYIYRLLATAYGRLGQESMARINLADEAMLQRKTAYAKSLAEGVLQNSPQGSHEWLRAKDIIASAEAAGDGKDDD